MSGLCAKDLRFAHPGGGLRLQVPRLELAAGQSLGLLGPSGVGKTTLLKLLCGLLQAQGGSIRLGKQELQQLSEPQRREMRLREMGLIFQDFALLDYLSVGENILLPARFGAPADQALALEMAGRLDLRELWQRPCAQLSQGERQRVAIVRALAHSPAFVFADEPTASLDVGRRDGVMQLLRERVCERGGSLILITHDEALMRGLDQRLDLNPCRA